MFPTVDPKELLTSLLLLCSCYCIPTPTTHQENNNVKPTTLLKNQTLATNATIATNATTHNTHVHHSRVLKPMFVKNVECSPHPTVVNTDPLSYYRYTPGIIQLYRCQGANSPQDLHFKSCVPTDDGIEDVDVSVINNNYQTPLTLTVRNHTACTQKCALEEGLCSPYQTFQPDACSCKCEYEKAPEPYPCTDPFFWEPSMCDCVCGVESKECEGNKEFNERTCKCECKLMSYVRCARSKKQVDETLCKCVETT